MKRKYRGPPKLTFKTAEAIGYSECDSNNRSWKSVELRSRHHLSGIQGGEDENTG